MSKQHSSRNHAKLSPATATRVADGAVHRSGKSRLSWKATIKTKVRRAHWLLPVALALLFSASSLWNDFASDDTQQILNNPFIQDLKNLPLAFTSSVWSFIKVDIVATATPYYRPLFLSWLGLNYAVVGKSAFGWHLSNILLHTLVTLLVFAVFNKFTGRRRLALLTACLFAVHPAHAESVAWISGFTDPLMSLFLLPAFYFYLRFRERDNAMWLVPLALFFLFSIWSKETAFALGLVIAYCELYHFKDDGALAPRLKRLMVVGVALLLPTVIYSLMRYQALGALISSNKTSTPFGTILATMPLVTLKYLKLMLVPLDYSYQHYTPWVMSFASVRFLLPLAALALLAAVVAFGKSRLLAFAGVWFVALLLPVIVALGNFDVEYLVQDRYLYLSSAGFCLAVALGIEWLAARLPSKRATWATAALTGIIVVVWGGVYFKQNRTWHNDLSVFERCVEVDSDAPTSHSSIATIYFGMGRVREAEAAALRALELDDQHIGTYQNLSYFSKQLGKMDQSIEYLERAVQHIPVTPITRNKMATVHLNLGLLYEQQKDFQRAEENILRSLELYERPVGLYYVGVYYMDRERYADALRYFERAAELLPPNYAPIHLPVAVVYEKLGQNERAIAAYHKYLQLVPQTVPDRENIVRQIRQMENKLRAK